MQEYYLTELLGIQGYSVITIDQISGQPGQSMVRITLEEGTWENCVNLRFIHYPEFQTSTQISA